MRQIACIKHNSNMTNECV